MSKKGKESMENNLKWGREQVKREVANIKLYDPEGSYNSGVAIIRRGVFYQGEIPELLNFERNERERLEAARLHIEKLLPPVIAALAADPVAVDGGENIGGLLGDLDRQYAWVNIDNRCYYLRVKDLGDVGKKDISESELKQRWAQIREQSRDGYARPLLAVECEIEAALFSDGDNDGDDNALPDGVLMPNKPSGGDGSSDSDVGRKGRTGGRSAASGGGAGA